MKRKFCKVILFHLFDFWNKRLETEKNEPKKKFDDVEFWKEVWDQKEEEKAEEEEKKMER